MRNEQKNKTKQQQQQQQQQQQKDCQGHSAIMEKLTVLGFYCCEQTP